jgi:hypothetical protein
MGSRNHFCTFQVAQQYYLQTKDQSKLELKRSHVIEMLTTPFAYPMRAEYMDKCRINLSVEAGIFFYVELRNTDRQLRGQSSLE